jgi:hypothetical protein
MLDLMRKIQQSNNYFWQGTAFPPNTTVTALMTINGSIALPAGTYVTGVSYYGSQPERFNLKIFDKGTKASIFYGDYIDVRGYASSMQILTGLGSDLPFGPHILMNPFIITEPGVLGWEIVNKSSSDQVIQVMLDCAIPVNQKTINQVQVKKDIML